jgi:hemoglobin
MMRSKAWLCVAAMSVALVACSGMQQPATGGASLFERLGGLTAITAVVDDFVSNIAADNRVNMFFAHADPVNLKRQLIDQVCAGTGGPCKYTGRDMKTVHQDMAITEVRFNAVVDDLVRSLDKFKVPAQEKGELLAILGSMKSQIVNTK